ncbi:hypothetical protein QYM46_18275 [Brevibacterium sp. K11IcPPYGO002]|uniref:hypothetical protein n=1 Tax=Brevibacterium sp. K11IcPPYGO002 TaxID=3058837 RepID=UPI003D81BEA1
MTISANAVRTPMPTRRSLLGGVAGLGSALLLSACSSGGSSSPESSASARKDGAPSRIVATSTGHLDHCLALGIMPVGMTVAVAAATNRS